MENEQIFLNFGGKKLLKSKADTYKIFYFIMEHRYRGTDIHSSLIKKYVH